MPKGEKLSPYFLSTTNKPGDRIIHVELRGYNYDEWSVKLKGAFLSRKKTGFIDGTILKPADDSDYLEDWYMVNAMLVNWIFNTIEPKLGSTISYVEVAKDLCDDIEQRFSVGNGPKLHRLKGSISACKQGDKEMATDYYGRLKKLWDEADNLLLQEPLPSLNRAYSTMIQEEGVRGKSTVVPGARGGKNRTEPMGFVARSSEPMGFAARTPTPVAVARPPEDGASKDVPTRPWCNHCNKWGHSRARCFDLIGYPKGWRDRGTGAVPGGQTGQSTTQGRGMVNHTRVTDDTTDSKEQ
ncbi:uncharacterized protein LOC141589847 [Silene latifolia]|uniref:uncharacterized protein LOC141589847 n=1 Tax=Silene latifolia TaxID=37657 RepID=UPI003D7875AB